VGLPGSNEVGVEPIGQLLSCDQAGREIEHQPLLLVDVCLDLLAVQHEKGLHRCMGDPLVSIETRVVERERAAERGGLGSQ
jgi:hypothetical protein